jgi:serine/threonine protein kinase
MLRAVARRAWPAVVAALPLASGNLARSENHNAEKNRFTFTKKTLGQGSYGVVRLATDTTNGKKVAVKFIRGCPQDAQNEIQAMTAIKQHGGHSHLLELIDVIEKPGQTLIVTEMVAGGEVFDRLVEKGPFSESDVARMASALADALDFLHGRCQTSHCDLKPENLMFTNPYDHVLKIVDFGSARRLDDKKIQACGTTVYWAPENFQWLFPRKGPPEAALGFGTQADMWAVGVCLFVCLYGLHPFDPQGQLEEREIAQRIRNGQWEFPKDENISESAKQLVRALLENDPRKRLTAHEMMQHPWVQGETASNEKIQGSATRLGAFQAARKKMQAGLLAAMIQESIQEQLFADSSNSGENKNILQKTFERFDTGNKGYLTPKDVYKAMQDMGQQIVLDDQDSRVRFEIKDMENLLADIPRKVFAPREVVFTQGQPSDNFYFIMDGQAQVYVERQEDGKQIHVATLRQGAFFGEAGVKENKTRSATVRCAQGQQPLQVLVLGKEHIKDFENILAAPMDQLVHNRAIDRFLTLFLSSSKCKSVGAAPGEIIFQKGQPSDKAYLINSGNVAIHHGVDKRSDKICGIPPGNILGETGVITGKNRNATAICNSTQGCSLSSLDKQEFINIMKQTDSFDMAIRKKNSASFLRTAQQK